MDYGAELSVIEEQEKKFKERVGEFRSETRMHVELGHALDPEMLERVEKWPKRPSSQVYIRWRLKIFADERLHVIARASIASKSGERICDQYKASLKEALNLVAHISEQAEAGRRPGPLRKFFEKISRTETPEKKLKDIDVFLAKLRKDAKEIVDQLVEDLTEILDKSL